MSVIGFGFSWAVLRRAVPWSTFRPERPHLETFRYLLVPGVAFVAFSVGTGLSLQGFTIVIGLTLGAAAVVVFSTTRTLTRVGVQALDVIKNSIWPELSLSIGSGRLDEAREILHRAVQGAVVGSLCLVIGMAFFGIPVIHWWTAGLVEPPI